MTVSIPKVLRAICPALFALALVGGSAAAEESGSVKLRWNLSWEPNIAGYRVHYGLESRDYTETVDVGYKVTADLSGLPPGTTYFAAVTAYNEFGLESEFSDEISFTVSLPPSEVDSDLDGLSDLFESTYGTDGVLDPLSDLDGDGMAALAEFFHGQDPTEARHEPIPRIEVLAIGNEEFMCARYLVDPAAENFVSMTIEHAFDLTPPVSWQTGQTVQVSSGPSPEHPGLIEVVARSIHPLGAQRMELVRFRHDVISAPSP